MMRIRKALLLAATFLVLSVGVGSAGQDDRAAILSLMERAFAAVATGSPEDWRAIQLAEGTSISFRPRANGGPGEMEMRMSTNEALLADVDDHKNMERWSGDPTVMTRGEIAVVWGEYEFWIDGEFSHCGVDSIDLVRVDGNWKIANWMWTVEKENCPTDPAKQSK